MLNLYQLNMFVAVAEAGSYSAAARQLNLTQPAVSMAVQALEKTLGGDRLFRRRGQHVELTPAGQRLLGPARRLLTLADETEHVLNAGQTGLAGRLRLGAATAAGEIRLAELLGGFCPVYPQVQVTLTTEAAGVLIDQLRAGERDAIVLAERVRGRTLEYLPLAGEEWVFVVPDGEAWASLTAVTDPASGDLPVLAPEQVREQSLVVVAADLPAGAGGRGRLPALLEERGLTGRDLRTVIELPNDLAVLVAVGAGAGIGLVGRAAAARWQGPGRQFGWRGGPLTRPLYLVRDRRVAPGPVAVAWWDWATRQAGGMSAPAGDAEGP